MIEIIPEDGVRKKGKKVTEYIKFSRPSIKGDWLDTLNDTKERRKNQICRTYKTKVDKSHLNKDTINQLDIMFLEAKWLLNYTLSQDNVFDVDYKVKKVPVKVKDTFEERNIKNLSSQMRQEIINRVIDNIKGLSKTKEKGIKIGKLKFKSDIRSIPLIQYGNTYKILDDKYIKIQDIKQRIRVNGLEQILDQLKDGIEIANGMLIKKHGDYYVHVVTYIDRNKDKKNQNDHKRDKIIPIGHVGIDFGISRQMTLSNRIVIKYEIPITDKIRKLYQSMSMKVLYSKNWYNVRNKLIKAYERLNNIKTDVKNKIIHCLSENFKVVNYQNDHIASWQHIYGRKILSTGIGEIKSMLNKKIQTPIEVNRFFPSTKTCCKCEHQYDIKINERIYKCNYDKCKNVMDRDLNSAICIDNEGLRIAKLVGTERIEFTPDEIRSSTLMLEYLNNIPYVEASLIDDPGSSLLWLGSSSQRTLLS